MGAWGRCEPPQSGVSPCTVCASGVVENENNYFLLFLKKDLHLKEVFGIICRVLRLLPHCVTVAQLTLDQFVKVRILVRQP